MKFASVKEYQEWVKKEAIKAKTAATKAAKKDNIGPKPEKMIED